jgi:hypothetical protein
LVRAVIAATGEGSEHHPRQINQYCGRRDNTGSHAISCANSSASALLKLVQLCCGRSVLRQQHEQDAVGIAHRETLAVMGDAPRFGEPG